MTECATGRPACRVSCNAIRRFGASRVQWRVTKRGSRQQSGLLVTGVRGGQRATVVVRSRGVLLVSSCRTEGRARNGGSTDLPTSSAVMVISSSAELTGSACSEDSPAGIPLLPSERSAITNRTIARDVRGYVARDCLVSIRRQLGEQRLQIVQRRLFERCLAVRPSCARSPQLMGRVGGKVDVADRNATEVPALSRICPVGAIAGDDDQPWSFPSWPTKIVNGHQPEVVLGAGTRA